VPPLLSEDIGPVLLSLFTAAVNLHSYLLGAPIFSACSLHWSGFTFFFFFAAVNLLNYLFCNPILMSVHL